MKKAVCLFILCASSALALLHDVRPLLPKENAVVPLLSEEQKAFFALSREERANIYTNVEKRLELVAAGDIPKPVVFAWQFHEPKPSDLISAFKSSAFGENILEIAEDAEFKNIVRRETTFATRLEVFNLKAGTKYWWRVSASGPWGWIVSTPRCFSTEDATPRLIKAGRIPNFRDLGGWKTVDGKRVKQGLIYRCAAFNDNYETYDKNGLKGTIYGGTRVDDAARLVAIGDLGIRTELDLRFAAGTERDELLGTTGSPLGPTVRWVNIPTAWYVRVINEEWGRNAFKEDFMLVSERANLPLAFHCIAGQDRTGCLAFLLNALLGVTEDDLMRDWEATCFCNSDVRFKHKTHIGRFLSLLKEKFPGKDVRESAEKFALDVGIPQERIDAFRAIMLETCK